MNDKNREKLQTRGNKLFHNGMMVKEYKKNLQRGNEVSVCRDCYIKYYYGEEAGARLFIFITGYLCNVCNVYKYPAIVK